MLCSVQQLSCVCTVSRALEMRCVLCAVYCVYYVHCVLCTVYCTRAAVPAARRLQAGARAERGGWPRRSCTV
jgi:hypothetical protein